MGHGWIVSRLALRNAGVSPASAAPKRGAAKGKPKAHPKEKAPPKKGGAGDEKTPKSTKK